MLVLVLIGAKNICVDSICAFDICDDTVFFQINLYNLSASDTSSSVSFDTDNLVKSVGLIASCASCALADLELYCLYV